MKIGQTGSANGIGNVQASSTDEKEDSVLKKLNEQLQTIKQKVQELSGNKDLTTEQKLEKRKEYQQQIMDINRQIMQRKQEIYREKHDKEQENAQSQKDSQQDTENASAAFTSDDMTDMIHKGTVLKSAKEGKKLKGALENRAEILETESAIDVGRGRMSERKDAQAADLKSRASAVTQKLGAELSKVSENADLKEDDMQLRAQKEEEEKEKERSKKEDTPIGYYVDEYR